jgi:unsaturated rhamnogalacturonyl hydrolase
MVQIYRATQDPLVLKGALGLAHYLITRPQIDGVFATWDHSPLQQPYGPEQLNVEEAALLASPPAGVFIDCLHFDPPFLLALGAAGGEPALVDEGARQAAGYVRLLQTTSGLFDHFVLEGSQRSYGPGWGRGQGWALLGLLDVLDELPAAHSCRPELAAATGRLIAAMIRLQRDDGHWYAVVDDLGSGDETSTAAFMAAGMLRAAGPGIGGDGILSGVSAAVNASTNPSHYAHVPRGYVVPWGQGPLALAIAQRLREDGAPAR